MSAGTVSSEPGARPRAPSGPVLFARYAYPPNRLGLCGPQDAAALLEGSLAEADPELRELARGFEGAYPYLRLIGESNGIGDPLHPQVVEAYWIGNPLTDRIPLGALHRNLDERFRGRMSRNAWRWLETSLAGASRPHHAFHVLEIFPRAGLMRSGRGAPVLATMDACRIRWGRVLEVDGNRLVVRARHLRLADGHLRLGPPEIETVDAWAGEHGPLDGAQPGDLVSLHWQWACNRLNGRQARTLARWTEAALEAANRTI